MGLLDWYHSRRIKAVSDKHPEVPFEEVKRDYYGWLGVHGNAALVVAGVPNGERSVSYTVDIICAADESIPSRLERAALNLGIL